jgi:hypothetical protein
MCSGGTPTSGDSCTVIPLKIDQIVATSNNNIIIKFNKPAYIIDDITSDDIEIKI